MRSDSRLRMKMPRRVVPLGAVVASECQERIAGVCLYPVGVGALHVYQDPTGAQTAVCKGCADYLIASGQWVVIGEQETPAESTTRFRQFLWEMKHAGFPVEKVAVGAKYQDERWIVRVPLSAGDYLAYHWVTEVQFGQFGWVRVAFSDHDDETPAVVEVRPIASLDEYRITNEAWLITTRRIN